MYSLSFKGINCLKYKIYVVSRPNVPVPKKRYTTIEIAGRDGYLIETDDCYDPITIPVQFNFMSKNENEWGEHFRKAKAWLEDGGTLMFSDDQGYYYKCEECSIDSTEREARQIGRFTANFLCDPYMYLCSGDEVIDNPNKLTNYYKTSHPIYIVNGSGGCTLTVNGKEVHVTVNGELRIDTDLMIIYNQEMVSQNTLMTGDYENLYLKNGDNTISISGADLKVIPRWRCK